jgi:uncharacterized protein
MVDAGHVPGHPAGVGWTWWQLRRSVLGPLMSGEWARLWYLVCGPAGDPAVDDPDRSVALCRDDLGWPTGGIVGQEFHDEVTGADGTIAIFTLDDGGLMLTLYERANLAKDASVPLGSPSSAEFSLGIHARSQTEVDDLLRHAGAVGGTLTAPARMRPSGVYSGSFTDPDGHLFEIAWDSDAAEPKRGRPGCLASRLGPVLTPGLTRSWPTRGRVRCCCGPLAGRRAGLRECGQRFPSREEVGRCPR